MNRRIPAVIAGVLLVVALGAVASSALTRDEAPEAAVTVATTTATTTTTTETVADPWEHANAALTAPTVDSVTGAARAMADTGDVTWVPYLIDLLRFYGTEDTIEPIADALATLTGEPVPDEIGLLYNHYGQWMHRKRPMPFNPEGIDDTYVEWKIALYSQADPAFAALLSQVDDPILASQLQWGGVRRGGIPELNAPATVSIDEAEWMIPDELTFGAAINGEVRAYPHRILDHHEMANDTLGGEPVALANCTLCRTGILFSRTVGDEELVFQSSGLLWNSNKVMVDVNTDTLWNQLTGEAITGPLTGTVLERFPITITTYGEWTAEHPDSTVLDIPGRTLSAGSGDSQIVGGYSYQPGDAYADYYASPYVWWPAAEVPDVFAEKDLVATLDYAGRRLAVGVDALAAGPQEFAVAGERVVAVPTDGGARFYAGPDDGGELALSVAEAGEEALTLADGTTLERIPSGHSFWFAWYANYPDTEWWPG